jgi:multidrug resistance efflux pump
MAETQAELESARSRVTEESQKLGSAAAVRGLTRESAELDTGKEGLVSNRELELFKLGALRAAAEEQAAVTLASASASRTESELAFLEARAAEWKTGIDRYQMFERRSHVLAPHAGWVRYGYLNHVRRKVQKTDDMPSGTPFVYVAEDERLSVEFFVPEHRIHAFAIGAKVQVRLPDEERRVEAVVRMLAPFPQEIGFLRGDDELPDAREKAYAVTADFDPTPPFFSSGIEVRVEP